MLGVEQLLDHRDNRPVGNALPIGQATAGQHPGVDAAQELSGQPGLADAGHAQDGDQAAGALLRDVREGFTEHPQLPAPAHQRRTGTTRPRVGLVADLQQPVGGHRLALALQPKRLEWLCGHRVLHQAPGLGADDDLARAGRLFQPRSQVNRVAGRQPLLRADHDLPGVHAGADAHGRAELSLESGVEQRQLLAQPGGRAYRPQRVVLVQHRDAEDGHHRIADEFLHRPAMMLDHPPGSVEISPHDLPEALRIQAFPQRRRPGHITEQHSDRLAPHARCRRRSQDGAAPVAEAGIRRVLPPAGRARPHTSKARSELLDSASERP